MKLLKEQILEIEKRDKKEIELARQFGVNISTISYHLNKEKRKQQFKDWWKRRTLEERKAIYKRRLPYLREYQRKHYKCKKQQLQ